MGAGTENRWLKKNHYPSFRLGGADTKAEACEWHRKIRKDGSYFSQQEGQPSTACLSTVLRATVVVLITAGDAGRALDTQVPKRAQ